MEVNENERIPHHKQGLNEPFVYNAKKRKVCSNLPEPAQPASLVNQAIEQDAECDKYEEEASEDDDRSDGTSGISAWSDDGEWGGVA